MTMAAYPGFENNYPLFEGNNCVDTQLRPPVNPPPMNPSNAQFNSDMFQPLPFEPILPAEWLSLDNPQWMPVPSPAQPNWDVSQPSHPSSYSNSSSSSYDPLNLMQGFPCETSPEFEAYSPPSTATSEAELPPSFDHFRPTVSSSAKPLLLVPVVPSSSRKSPPAPVRRMRRPSKDSPKSAADERKYQCDFCPVQMARLHDINRHMRIHTGVHPYACIGCGETFRRTDARTRHWCKQPECFKIHSAKAPVSKVRRRIP